MPNEEWRDVVGYPGYQVSNLGNVRSFLLPGRRTVARDGIARNPHALRSIIRHGDVDYAVVGLYKGAPYQRVMNVVYVHRIVLETFIGCHPENMEARHLNGNSLDNRAENLAWGTARDNTDDKVKHGSILVGKMIWTAKLTEEDVARIRQRYLSGEMGKDLAQEYGVSKATISRCVNAVCWRHVP